MTTLVEYCISILAAVTLVLQLFALRRSKLSERGPFALAGLVLVSITSLLYEAGIAIRGQVGQIVIISVILLVFFGVVSTSIRSRQVHRIPLSAFLPAIVSAMLFSVNALMNLDVDLSQLLGRSLGIISLALLGLVFSLVKLQLRDIAAAMIISVSFMFALSPFIGDSWRPCDKFKCGPFNALYIGPFDSENTVALLCGAALLCAFAAYSGKKRIIGLALFALTLYATESRTSQLAIAAGLAAWPLAAPAAKWATDRAPTLRARLERCRLLTVWAGLAIFALFAVGFHLLMEATPSDFSNRGNVWILGLNALGENWVSGLGVDRWYTFQSVGVVPSHFPHSEYLFLLFTGGVGAVLGLFIIYVRSLGTSLFYASVAPFAFSYVVFLGVSGMTELLWNPIAADGNTLIIFPLFFIVALSRTNRAPRDHVNASGVQQVDQSSTHRLLRH